MAAPPAISITGDRVALRVYGYNLAGQRAYGIASLRAIGRHPYGMMECLADGYLATDTR